MIERIKTILELSGSSPAQFAAAIGINRSNLTHLFSGRNQPSLELAKKILLAFPEVKTEWLIMGVGPMTKTDESRIQSPIVNIKEEPTLFSEEEETNKNSIPRIEVKEIEAPFEDIPKKSERNVTKNNPLELKNEVHSMKRDQLFNSQKGKQVDKIVIFYNDHTFEIYLND